MVSLTLFRLAAGTALALCLVFTGCVDGVKVTNSESRTNWTLRQSPTEYDLYNVIWNGSEFRAVGFDGTMISSPDGISWKAFEHPEIFGSWPGHIAWSDKLSLYIVAGGENMLKTSPDGDNWTDRTSGFSSNNHFNGVAVIDTIIVAVGDEGVAVSTNGIQWTPQTLPQGIGLGGVAASDTLLIGFAYNGIYSSIDGFDWAQRSNEAGLLYGAAWWPDRNRWLAVGHLGLVMTSPDGIQWTRIDVGAGDYSTLFDVYPAGSTCYIVGSGNGPAEILSSHDGQVWSKLVLEDYGWLRGITGSPRRLVIVGNEGVILTKPRVFLPGMSGVKTSGELPWR